MKKTILILALMLVAITAFGAMTPAPKTSDHTGLSAGPATTFITATATFMAIGRITTRLAFTWLR
jgi:hypothetical protein